jgi:hypothetical protein
MLDLVHALDGLRHARRGQKLFAIHTRLVHVFGN